MLLISPLAYYEFMDLSPHVLINNNDVASPVITVIFNVVLQVYVHVVGVISFVLFVIIYFL